MSLVRWPMLEEADKEAVIAVLESGILVKGPVARQLEDAFAAYVGVRYCRAVGSCTHAIHLGLRALGIGLGDEVLVPNLTYCGSVSPIINCGAMPVFVDVDPVNYNLCPRDASTKRSRRTKAAIVVHLHGYPCNMDTIIKALPNLLILEDACQAHGAMRGSERVGSWGDAGCFSLNQVKPLCGGQGGMIVTDSDDLWSRIFDLASPGHNTTVGLSYEITEVSAAIALSQLRRLDDILSIGRRNYVAFQNHLAPRHRCIVQPCEDNVKPTWHKLRLRPGSQACEAIRSSLDAAGVPYETWPGTLVSKRSEYSGYTACTPISDSIISSSLILGNEQYPFHAQGLETVAEWASVINSALDRAGKVRI